MTRCGGESGDKVEVRVVIRCEGESSDNVEVRAVTRWR